MNGGRGQCLYPAMRYWAGGGLTAAGLTALIAALLPLLLLARHFFLLPRMGIALLVIAILL